MVRQRAIQPSDFGYDQARHLIWRAGFGGTPEQIRTLADMGPEAAVDVLIGGATGTPSGASVFSSDIIRPLSEQERQAYRRAQQTRDEDELARFRLRRQEAQRSDRRQMRDIQKWWITEMIQSSAPAREKMVLFWHGHFATSYRTIEDSWHMLQQNDLFRTHAMGNFGELMFRIIRDPAMLAYLDNNDSRAGAPNENLARELLELFSLGVGNYTEQDIKEGARALTGYTFLDDEFTFREDFHDANPKRFLGVSGNLDGDGFVRAILSKRACAGFLCRKLYRFFAADLPPDDQIDERELDRETRLTIRAMQRALLNAKYDIAPALRELWLSEHFYSSTVVGQQIKSPVTLVVGAMRSLITPARDLSVLLDAMDRMGQNLFFPPSVKGWDGGRAWINTATLFVRQNALVYMLTGRLPDRDQPPPDSANYDPSPMLTALRSGNQSPSSDEVIEFLLKLTLGGVPRAPRDRLRAFASEHARADSPTDDLVIALLLLITAMPEYQLT